jgi:hypothetical protein
MGFVQAQDYLGALWAIGLRTHEATELNIEKALADRSIIRTWLARGTLHFAAAEDVRWMLALLAPRVISRMAGRYRQLDLDEEAFDRSRKMVMKALKGGNQLTRKEMYQALEAGHILTAGQRGIHILGRLALEGLICLGAREGKQQTFVLLDEWNPQTEDMTHDQALTELTRRYFMSHGPATLQDFLWWSGLTTSEVKAGLEMCAPFIEQERINGQVYWQSQTSYTPENTSLEAYLLPAFDEYLVGYKIRADVLDPRYAKQVNAGGGMLNPAILIEGQVMGTWKRTLGKGKVAIVPSWFTTPTQAHEHAFNLAVQRYGAFLDLPVSLMDE